LIVLQNECKINIGIWFLFQFLQESRFKELCILCFRLKQNLSYKKIQEWKQGVSR
jgi:hypothetical protein